MIKEAIVKISSLAHNGMGMAKIDGHRILVRGSYPGDEYIVSYDSENKKVQDAITYKRIKDSENRVIPACQFHGHDENSCNGCPWMGLNYQGQLQIKLDRLKHAFERINEPQISDIIKTIHPAQRLEKFRARSQVKTDGKIMGFVTKERKILDIPFCLAMNDKVNDLYQKARTALPNDSYKPTPPHLWCFLDLDESMAIEELKINSKYHFSQAMSDQNNLMKSWVSEIVDMISRERGEKLKIIELFAGGGNFTEVLKERASLVDALEIQTASLEKLKKTSSHFSHLSSYAVNLFQKSELDQFWAQKKQYDLLFANPPEEGMKFARQWIFETGVRDLIYVSCSTESFVDDARQFLRAGMKAIKIELVDQFPHTPHVETISYWSKR